jgi:hypothetical protein
MIKQALMIQGKDNFSFDLANFPLILLYSSIEICFAFLELVGFGAIVLIV